MLPRLAISVTALALSCSVSADQLRMKNGSILVGTVVRASEDSVIFDTPFAGEITLAQENIESMVTTETVTLLMDSGQVYRNKRVAEEDGVLTVTNEDERPVTLDLATVDFINPEPWRLGEGYKWSGQVNAALESERGNSDSD